MSVPSVEQNCASLDTLAFHILTKQGPVLQNLDWFLACT